MKKTLILCDFPGCKSDDAKSLSFRGNSYTDAAGSRDHHVYDSDLCFKHTIDFTCEVVALMNGHSSLHSALTLKALYSKYHFQEF